MKNKKQHYLPKCYLRNFSTDDLIWTYNKKQSRSYRQNISSAGQKGSFYKMSEKYLGEGDEKRDPNFIEKEFFANYIEPKFANILRKVKAKHQQWVNSQNTEDILTEEERMELAALLGIQFLRMPYIQDKYWNWLNQTANARTEIIKAFIKSEQAIDAGELENFKLRYDEAGKSIIHSTIYANQELVDQYQDAILNKYWVFQVADVPQLYTSDFPMIVRPHLPGQPYLLEGFDTRGAEIIFPLSTSILLTLWDPRHFSEKAVLDNHFVALSTENLGHYNTYQYSYAISDVYALKDDFGLINQLKQVNNNQEFFALPPSIRVY